MDGEKVQLKKEKYNRLYMDIAERVSEMSYATRLKVGCVIEKNGNIISFGWNGMPEGWNNECEYIDDDGKLRTKPECLHSEANAIAKLAKSPESGLGASLFVTHSPCMECAKLIHQSGINAVFFKHRYRDDLGINFLKKSNIYIEEIN